MKRTVLIKLNWFLSPFTGYYSRQPRGRCDVGRTLNVDLAIHTLHTSDTELGFAIMTNTDT
jgi:hypothetical protein